MIEIQFISDEKKKNSYFTVLKLKNKVHKRKRYAVFTIRMARKNQKKNEMNFTI